jgi:enterochelin esterase-like enzyme
VAGAALGTVGAAPSRGTGPTKPFDDALPARLDNGAAGRNPFHNPGHRAPVEVCRPRAVRSRRSQVVRVLPDGPRAPDGALAFTSGVCVYLPTGYATSTLRYPVLYLLHGGGGDAADAVNYGGLQQTMDQRIQANPRAAAIVVMPDGDDAQWYDSPDGTIKNEQYVVDAVIPYVDHHFRTLAGRNGRAIAGVSNGGFGAMLFAAKHPRQFVAAAGMSSNLDALTLAGLGDRAGAWYHANHPAELARSLAGTALYVDVATSCTSTNPADLCATQAVDATFVPANRTFVGALRSAGHPRRDLVYREVDASHQWSSWGPRLRDRVIPFLFTYLARPHA